MNSRIAIVGGYGLLGSNIARQVRKLYQNVEIILAGRNPDKGKALAQELGNAATEYFDLEASGGYDALEQTDLIVAALHDPADALIEFALAKGIAHIGMTKNADDIAPIAFAALRTPPKRPIALLSHCMGGVMTTAALKTAEPFSRIDSIETAWLYDDRDAIGPMVADEMGGYIGRALIRQAGQWAWVESRQHARPIHLDGDVVLEAYPMGSLDVPSLASATSAANVRFDLLRGDSLGTRAGGQASTELYIDIAGVLKTGKLGKLRTVVTDPNGQAHLTALGLLVAIERILGLDGLPAAAGGIHLPETLFSVDAAIARYEQFGVRVSIG